MKNKISKPIVVLSICFVGVLLCVGLYYFVDNILNGSFVDWFESNYMITQEQYIPEANTYGLVRQPVYSKLKILLFWILIVGLVFWLTVILLISHFRAKAEVRKAVTQISKVMHEFMQSERDAADLFPFVGNHKIQKIIYNEKIEPGVKPPGFFLCLKIKIIGLFYCV